MSDHLACIGISAAEPQAFEQTLNQLAARAPVRARPDGGKLLAWRDRSGAALVLQLGRKGEVLCFTPTFDGASRIPAVPRRLINDSRCPFCERMLVDVRDDEGRVVYPLIVSVEDAGAVRDRIPLDEDVTLSVTAFAEVIESWPDEPSFLRDQGPGEPGVEALLPAGLYADQPAAEAIFTGRVLASEVRTNASTGQRFVWAHVKTQGGAYDVVASTESLPTGLAPGAIVQGVFWMVGRVVQGLKTLTPPSKKAKANGQV
ncbi:MAG: hypothetical protein KF878_04875 [Planctomycetes bacterium]|nr:hypothetical protein [Planctomycetota bacterium]